MVSPSYADFAPAIDQFSQGLLNISVRSMVLLGLVSLAVVSMRRASAAKRHWVWLMGFVGLLLLPLLSAALPGWRILPHFGSNPLAASATNTIASTPTLNAEMNLHQPAISQASPQRDLSTTNHDAGNSYTASAPASASVVAANARAIAQPSPVEHQATDSTLPRLAALPWNFWLVLAWLVGSVMVLGHLFLGHLRLWLLQRRCVRINDGEWHEQVNRLRKILNVRREVELLSVQGDAMPMTWGIWRAKLLLPDEAASWTTEQRRDVLLHELGHVRRADCATQLLVQIACALYWFNPLAWFAWSRVQVERERACDDIVLNTGTIASTYAEHLLQSATAMRVLRFATPALAMARAATLESRLCTILDSKRNRRGLSGSTTWITLALLLIALVPMAVLQAQENTATDSGRSARSLAGDASNTGPATRPASSGEGRRFANRGMFGGGGMPAAAQPEVGEGPTCAFGATIYDLRLPADKIGQIDLDALNAAAATPAGFEKALAELGTMRPLYHTDQTVRLASDTITIGTQTPIVTASRTDGSGHASNIVSYQETGAHFSIAGKSNEADKIECDLKIELSTISASSAEIATSVKASLFRTSTMLHKGIVVAKKPFVVLSADAATADENGKAVVYIARVTLGEPQ
ncbi:MAG TPA: M56 family metallopeptidase [Tepidisphaeraceae bacterium]|jgi:beta-lactamase regulating signal transducer with metallopeptidase domain|nr:M56 family metallopeptidase [Tepidisphaeraceae bacterium]